MNTIAAGAILFRGTSLIGFVCVNAIPVNCSEFEKLSNSLQVTYVAEEATKSEFVKLEIKNLTDTEFELLTRDESKSPEISMPEFLLLEFDGVSRWIPRPLRKGTLTKSPHRTVIQSGQSHGFRYKYGEFSRNKKYRLRDNLRGVYYSVTVNQFVK